MKKKIFVFLVILYFVLTTSIVYAQDNQNKFAQLSQSYIDAIQAKDRQAIYDIWQVIDENSAVQEYMKENQPNRYAAYKWHKHAFRLEQLRRKQALAYESPFDLDAGRSGGGSTDRSVVRGRSNQSRPSIQSIARRSPNQSRFSNRLRVRRSSNSTRRSNQDSIRRRARSSRVSR